MVLVPRPVLFLVIQGRRSRPTNDLWHGKRTHKTRCGWDRTFCHNSSSWLKHFDQFSGYQNYSDLNFSPDWREDYEKLNNFRLNLYRKFLIWKFMFHPWKIIKQSYLFLSRKFLTKMEMTPFRALHTFFL